MLRARQPRLPRRTAMNKKTSRLLLLAFTAAVVATVVLVLVVVAALRVDADVLEDGSVLVVDLSRPLGERGERRPTLSDLLGEASHPLPAHEAASAIRRAGTDAQISAILLNGGVSGSLGSLEMVRDALLAAKQAGKPIYAQYGSANERMLWFASAADEIWLEPLGIVEFDGWSGEILYFGDALKQLGVEVQVTRVGKYKSAVEPYMLGHMSPENREQLEALIHSIESHLLGGIAAARGLEVETLRKWTQERGWFTAKAAVDAGLATHAAPYAELLAELREKADVEEGDEVPTVSLAAYAREVRKSAKDGDGVRVIVADGEIVDGSSTTGIGGDDLARELRAAREEEDTRAVVLRVDSPGGSATASDVIRSEVLALKAAGKPVIVSMGSLAASGGYWISADADYIVANEATLTGSIGVFGMLPNAQDLAESHGLRAERFATSPLAGVGSMWRRLDGPQLAVMQGVVDEIYERFLDLVAEGRKLDRAQVQEIAQGRVWMGAKAKELGLVDELGDLDRAIAVARERAHLDEDAPVRYATHKEEWFDELLEELLASHEGGLARSHSAQLVPALSALRASALLDVFRGRTHVFARLPFDLQID